MQIQYYYIKILENNLVNVSSVAWNQLSRIKTNSANMRAIPTPCLSLLD